MIKLDELIMQIRIKVKDLHEVKYSDYDLELAINECLRIFIQAIALSNTTFAQKEVYLDQDEMNEKLKEEAEEGETVEEIDFLKTGVDLPEDMLTLLGVYRDGDGYKLSPTSSVRITDRQYRIFGEKLYCRVTKLRLQYKCILAVEEIEEGEEPNIVTYKAVKLPKILFDIIVKITIMILNNVAEDITLETTNKLVEDVIPIQKFSNVKLRMPFMV